MLKCCLLPVPTADTLKPKSAATGGSLGNTAVDSAATWFPVMSVVCLQFLPTEDETDCRGSGTRVVALDWQKHASSQCKQPELRKSLNWADNQHSNTDFESLCSFSFF